MASPPLLDLDALLTPIEGDDGTAIPRMERGELDDLRKEKDDPAQVGQTIKANWPEIIKRSQQLLQTRSKDLVIASRLVEALFQQHGFSALSTGFQLLRRMLVECWDKLCPPVEDGDLDPRAGAIGWLCSRDMGARFPSSIRLRPLLRGQEGFYSFLDWQHAQENRPNVNKEDVAKAMQRVSLDDCVRLHDIFADAVKDLTEFGETLRERLAGDAPDIAELRSALVQCQQLMQQLIKEKKPPEEAAASEAATQESEDGAPSAKGPVGSRAEAYRQLAQAAAVLRQLEPHSPIPYLVQRAVQMGALPFPEMIRELIREPNVLSELRRELGIPAEGPPPETPPSE